MRRLIWLGLLIVVLISFLFVFLPAWIIQPFKAQTPGKLQFAYHLRSVAPIVTVIAAVITLVSIFYLWSSNPRWWKKAALLLSLIVASTVMQLPIQYVNLLTTI
jgi:hypothetical protein